jgi:hypothetical protein
MSNPSKAWALLTARGAQLDSVHGGIPDITPADIARMLQGLAPGPFNAAMVKDSGDASCLGPLERWLWIDAMWMAEQQEWPRSHGQAYCRRLAGLAVYEFVMPRPEVCSGCGGRGYRVFEGNGIECPRCVNTGGEKLAPEMRADLAGIPLKSWLAGWSERYEEVHLTVLDWHSVAMRHLARALGNRQWDEADSDED